MRSRHIAQMNIGKLKFPLEHAANKEFVSQLLPVNEKADNFIGFIWRLKTECGYSADLQLYPDPQIIINLTVWESLEALKKFTYQEKSHLSVLRNRKKWFLPISPSYVLWYIEKGTFPTIEEGKKRLDYLEKYGATEYAFTFQCPY